jgi:ketopantoate reductase
VRFLVAGAGAIGAYLGARMARAGEDVTLFARGPHLRAMQANGVRILSPEGDFEIRPKVVEKLGDAGPVDVIFLGVKAHSLTQLVLSAGGRRILRTSPGARGSRRSDRPVHRLASCRGIHRIFGH